jgi:aryl sulfotransferase
MNAPSRIVWLASFLKSGNTWFRIFLANLARHEPSPADINNLDQSGGIASDRHEFEMATMLDSSLLSHDEIDDLRPRVYAAIAAEARSDRWVKVHDAYTTVLNGEPLLGRNVARAAIYLVRDPRDVVVSLSYHDNMSIEDALKCMNSSTDVVCGSRKGLSSQLRQKMLGWSGHVTSWLDQTDVPVHVLRYEDLLRAPTEFFVAALKFSGRTATPASIERAVRHADFLELQRQESENGFVGRESRIAPFFRSGRAGGWRDILTAEQIALIEERHAPTMQRLGYELCAKSHKEATADDQRVGHVAAIRSSPVR